MWPISQPGCDRVLLTRMGARAQIGREHVTAETGTESQALTEAEKRNAETVQRMVGYLSSHNVPGMLSCFDDEMEWLDIPMEASYRGKAEIGAFLDSLFDAFP